MSSTDGRDGRLTRHRTLVAGGHVIERGDLGGASPALTGDGEALLGREREMAALRAALASASRGRGRLVLLSGEAGIGKTRLADAFAVEARDHGARVAWGRCWEAGGAPVYWPWLQAVRSLLRDVEADDLRRLIGPDGSHIAQVLPEIRDALPELPSSPTMTRIAPASSCSTRSRGCCGTPPRRPDRPDPRRSPRRRRAVAAAAPLRVHGPGRHRSRGAGHLPRG